MQRKNFVVNHYIDVLVLVAGVLGVYSILHWITTFNLSPDSTNYIAAARNLLEHGQFVVYANWPGFSLEPTLNPYTDYPPGFPLYLLPFLVLSGGNVVWGALLAQSLAIVLCYVIVYFLINQLRFGLVYGVITLIVFTFLTPFSVVFTYFWTETLFIFLSFSILLCCIEIIKSGKKKYWYIGITLLAASVLLKFVGVFNAVFFVIPVWQQRHRLLWGGAVVCTAILPAAAWIVRNAIFFEMTTQSHNINLSIRENTILHPLNFFVHLFNLYNASLPVFVVFLVLVLFVSITVITLPLRINIHGTDMNIHLTILLGFFFHAVGVYVLSLVASFDHLDERLLSPTIGVFMLAFINGLRHVLEDLRGKILLLTTVILLCLTYPSLFQLESPLDRQESNFISIGYPVEMFLWEELDKMAAIQSSTVFFTDIFSHQLFTDIPQKLLINHESGITRLQNPEDVRALLEIGQNPFFLFVSGSEADRYLSNTYQQVGLRRIEFPHLGFVLYSSPG